METLSIILSLIKQQYPSDASFEIAAGLKPKTVDSWKRGNSKGYLKVLPLLSDVFGVSADYLLGKTEDVKFKNPPAEKAEGVTIDIPDNLQDDVKRLIDIFVSLDDSGRTMVMAKAIEEQREQKAAEAAKQISGTA